MANPMDVPVPGGDGIGDPWRMGAGGVYGGEGLGSIPDQHGSGAGGAPDVDQGRAPKRGVGAMASDGGLRSGSKDSVTSEGAYRAGSLPKPPPAPTYRRGQQHVPSVDELINFWRMFSAGFGGSVMGGKGGKGSGSYRAI